MFPVPLNEQVIIKVDEAEVSPAGIIIEGASSLPTTGTIYAVGEDCWISTGVNKILVAPDRVLFQKGAGIKFNHDGEEYYIMKSEHLLAKI